MSSRTDELQLKIGASQERIVSLFRDQCKHGKQTTSLNTTDGAACGQFLEVSERSQRGIHGTAAAVRVLANDTNAESVALVKRLVHYFRNRKSYEESAKCRDDDKNVIKMAETIAALDAVPQATVDTSDVKTRLATALRSSIKHDNGWSYFLNDDETPQALPTAYACYALTRLGADTTLKKARDYLLNHLKRRYLTSQVGAICDVDADTMTDVFCLYVLADSGTALESSAERNTMLAIFDNLWDRLAPLLHNDLEQNIEYWHDDKTFYVRVPWQLYLLALAANYSMRKKFSSRISQNYLTRTLQCLNNGGFRYPHSGKYLSARTYSILHEVLTRLNSHLVRDDLSNTLLALDTARELATSGWARWIVRGAILILIAYIAYRALPLNNRDDYAGLAVNLIAPLIVTASSWSNRRP